MSKPDPTSDQAEHETLFTHLHIRPDAENAFAGWQAKLNKSITAFEQFVSLEILSSQQFPKEEWTIIQRFENDESLKRWHQSQERDTLFEELKPYLDKNAPSAFKENYQPFEDGLAGVTEVFVTHVLPSQIDAYRKWIGKIHQAESKFPGFRRIFVQSPKDEKKGSWITLLQFDTPEQLDLRSLAGFKYPNSSGRRVRGRVGGPELLDAAINFLFVYYDFSLSI